MKLISWFFVVGTGMFFLAYVSFSLLGTGYIDRIIDKPLLYSLAFALIALFVFFFIFIYLSFWVTEVLP